MQTQEKVVQVSNGWLVLAVQVVVGPVLIFGFLRTLILANAGVANPGWLIPLVLCIPVWGVCWGGFFTLQPNVSAVLLLFGKYRGTVKTAGFHWANPLLRKIKLSMRSRNLNGDKIKVNDARGNPIEIAAVVVWHVENTAQAKFDVEDFTEYVQVQSEAAVRHLATAYPYDDFEGSNMSLRGNMDEVSAALHEQLRQRTARAGIVIEEAYLSHLAYATEIAGAMLQRQQAEAVVSARTRIVEGAVGMVEMALAELEKGGAIELDEERKAAMVSNLLVVLCGDKNAQPVVNTGTLYQ